MAKGKPHKINFWEMLRDVLVAAINKGQLPQAGVVLVLVVAILRMPGSDVTELGRTLLQKAGTVYYLGWMLALIALIGWGLHVKHVRSVAARELKRVTEERNKYQQRAIKNPIASSDDP